MGRRIRPAAPALILLLGFAAAAGAASPGLEAARKLRREGCPGLPGTPAALVPDASLDAAARDWSRGTDLSRAIEAAGLAPRSTVSLRTSARRPDALSASLRRELCAELTAARHSRWGEYADTRGSWLVLVEPAQPPDPERATDIAEAVRHETNRARARARQCGDRRMAAAAPLGPAPQLDLAAKAYATEIARTGRLSHEGTSGSTPATRARGAGYEWRTIGENLAAGPESAAEVVADWLASPGHCANLMDPAFTETGLAFQTAPDSGRTWWVQLLGRPRASRR